MNIKSLAEDDRPREKFLSKGKTSLSDAELLAIILGNGSKNESVIVLAQNILASVNHNWHELAKLSISDLCKFNGIGKVKAIEIQTVLEIGRRRSLQKALHREQMDSSKDAFEILHPFIGDLDVEEFWAVFLNQKHKILKTERISQGGISNVSVDVRLIFKRALELNAASLIIGHNHPSNDLTPSRLDKELTQNVKEAGNLLNILLLDHLIITQTSYLSFADKKIL
ncbi:MAG: DNA repair protein RadC [Flavobacteriaceae bacterium]|nr:DNA repair protein RadC [Flavobacteriaceae bacterium]